MTVTTILAYCTSGFALGYAVGYVLLLVRKAFEVID